MEGRVFRFCGRWMVLVLLKWCFPFLGGRGNEWWRARRSEEWWRCKMCMFFCFEHGWFSDSSRCLSALRKGESCRLIHCSLGGHLIVVCFLRHVGCKWVQMNWQLEKKNNHSKFPRSNRTKDLSSLAKVMEEIHELNNDPAECVTQLQEERWEIHRWRDYRFWSMMNFCPLKMGRYKSWKLEI